MIPVYKSRDPEEETNYRPISVLPILSKKIFLEKAVHNQLKQYLDENNLFVNCQFGYREKRSTETAATLFVDDIRKEIGENLVGAIFIDLSKAFDTVSHAVMIEKLKSYGIDDCELSWFTDHHFSTYTSCSSR